MAHHAYATLSEATQCLMDAIGIVRQGWDQVIVQKAAFMEHEHAVQGFLHSVAFGTSDGPFTSESAEAQSAFAEKLEEFAAAVQEECPDEIPMSAVEEVVGTNLAADEHGLKKIDFKKWLTFFTTYILPLLLKE